MAFSQKELDIIKWGLENGKSKSEVTAAISNFRAGVAPSKTTATPQIEQEPNFGQRVSTDITEAGSKINEAISGTGEFEGQGSIARGTAAAATAANTVLKVGAEALPQPARQAISWVGEKIGQGFQLATDEIAKTKLFKELGELEAQGFINKETTPSFFALKDALSTASSAGQIAGDIAAVGQGVKTAQSAVDVTKNIATKAKNATVNTVKDVKGSITKGKAVKPLDAAIKDATPNYETSTAIQKGKLLTRTQEGGLLKGRTVKPNKLEIEAGKELSKVKGYNPNDTKLSKFQVAEKAAIQKAKKLEVDIGKEKAIVPKKEISSVIKKSIDKVTDSSLLLQKADPAVLNYMRVVNNALSKVSGNLKGVLKLRKTLDTIYKNAKGKGAFGDKIAVLDEIHTAARDSLYEYLISKATNTAVKASIKAQWDLYRAMDILKIAAEKESGSMIGRLIQNNPLTAKAVRLGAEATGLGAGIKIIQ